MRTRAMEHAPVCGKLVHSTILLRSWVPLVQLCNACGTNTSILGERFICNLLGAVKATDLFVTTCVSKHAFPAWPISEGTGETGWPVALQRFWGFGLWIVERVNTCGEPLCLAMRAWYYGHLLVCRRQIRLLACPSQQQAPQQQQQQHKNYMQATRRFCLCLGVTSLT